MVIRFSPCFSLLCQVDKIQVYAQTYFGSICRVQSITLFLSTTLLIDTQPETQYENVNFPFAFVYNKMFSEDLDIKVKTVRFR